jgi:flagellar export protein FliJ
VTAGRIVNLRTWCTVLEIRRNERAAAYAEARRDANDAFRLLTAAAREREALDRFHEKSQRLWQREFQADEQKMFDELAVQRQAAPLLEKSRLN